MATHLVWFRADLRVRDNPALAAACQSATAKVLALYIATPGQWQQHDMSARQAHYLWAHLDDLQHNLAERGIPLTVLQVDDFAASIDSLSDFADKNGVDALFYNYQYPVNERARDATVEKRLDDEGVVCQGFDANLLLAPGSVTPNGGKMYKVFTPFSKACVQRLREGVPECLTAPHKRGDAIKPHPLPALDYPKPPDETPDYPVGEAAALARLRTFCQQSAANYPDERNFPAHDGTSQLSAWLTLGVLSPRQCLHRLLTEHPQALAGKTGWVWLNELLWREFYNHLLVVWPKLSRHQPFIAWTDNVVWRQDEKALKAWQEGNTGYPIVDAAMRALNQTGWMHNRLRMVCASFLTKDLLIDWRKGERYFMQQLIDGDLAANNGGWQWAASTGTDSTPYFRIFNPTTQGERFDPQGEFVRRWLPELSHVPDNSIHEPWRWAEKNHQQLDYPKPCVDHKLARQQTLDAWYQAKNKDAS